MQLTASMAETLIAELGMDDLPLIEVRPIPTKVDVNWFSKYKELCRQFMMSLTDSVDTGHVKSGPRRIYEFNHGSCNT